MRKTSYILLILATVLASCTPEPEILQAVQTIPTQGEVYILPTSESTAQDIVIPTSSLIPECVGSQQGVIARVLEVMDGDTILVNINGTRYKVRYFGVDAPELLASDPQPGKNALKMNKTLVEGKEVELFKADTDRDDYGRLLRFVFVDTTFVNLELVNEGLASSFNRPHDAMCSDLFDEAMYLAYRNGKGIWGAVRDQYQPTVEAACPDGCTTHKKNCDIKGNISRNDEYIFHLPGSKDYDNVSISSAKGELWFCTIDEAIKNGWRPPRVE